MSFTAEEIAELTGGTAFGSLNIVGEKPDRIEDAGFGSITFYNNSKYRQYLTALKHTIVLVDLNFSEDIEEHNAVVKVTDPMLSFAQILTLFEEKEDVGEICPSAFVASNVKVEEGVWIGELAYVGALSVICSETKIYPQVYIGKNVRIGTSCILYPGVKIYDNSVIGDRCILHAGVVIGSDGFGYVPEGNGHFSKIPQLGNVIIEDDVEVGANSTIDRAVTGSTIVRRGAKIDNLVMVGHNVEIGEYTMIAAQAGVSGSTKLGDHCQIGGQAGFAGHLEIAPFTKVNAQSGFGKSVKEPGKAWSGSPAREFQRHYRMLASTERLPHIEREIAAIKEILSLLQAQSSNA